MTGRSLRAVIVTALVGSGLVAVAQSALAAPPPLSAECQLMHDDSSASIVSAGGSISLNGSFNASEQALLIGTTADAAAVTLAVTGAATQTLHAASGDNVRYTIPTSGAYTLHLTSDTASSTSLHIDCGYAPTGAATVNGGTSPVYGTTATTHFSCTGQTYPIATCVDSNGDTDGTGQADTSQAGTFNYSVTATDTHGLRTTTTVQYTVIKADPVITWSNPAAITYGTALSATQLNATANVPGVFGYSPDAGTVLHASPAPQTLTVSFQPSDGFNYNTASAQVTIVVNRATQAINFTSDPTGAAVGGTYAPSADATSGVPVSFTVGPASVCTISGGIVTYKTPGTCTVTGSDAGNGDYLPTTGTQPITVGKGASGLSPYPSGKAFLDVGTTTFKAYLYRGGDLAPIVGAKITFWVSGKAICTATTKPTGQGTCSGHIGISNTFNAKTFTVTYAGNALYLGTSAIGSFTS